MEIIMSLTSVVNEAGEMIGNLNFLVVEDAYISERISCYNEDVRVNGPG